MLNNFCLGKDNLEDLELEERILLKLILQIFVKVMDWTYFDQDRSQL